MAKENNQRITGVLVFAAVVIVFIWVSVNSGRNSSQNHPPKKEFGKIYRAEDGHYYTRSHDRNGFSDWEFIGADAGGDSSFSKGSWSRVTTTPSGMSATSKVVVEENGKPTEEVEEESAAETNEEVTESTAESEAEGMDSASDSGGDAGDGGGGDGGGDGGGGSE